MMSSSRAFSLAANEASSSGVRLWACFICCFFCSMATYSAAPRSRTEYPLRVLIILSRYFWRLSSIRTVVLERLSSEKMMLPLLMNPLVSSIPAKVLVRTDFPEPDSPTIARLSFS